MNAIIVNTLTGAVAEYTGFGFQCITPTHAGSATGLFELGGNLDVALPIVSRVQTGKPQWEGSLKKRMHKVFFGLKGEGTFMLHVAGEVDEWEYAFSGSVTGEARAQPGKGIRETYLSYGMSNPDGQQFQLDNIEIVQTLSTTRRV